MGARPPQGARADPARAGRGRDPVRVGSRGRQADARRFDRTAGGRKRGCEDFCQLAGLPPKDKYEGSIEACARIAQRFASEPPLEILTHFGQALFAWWTGDGDLHRKNLSLLHHEDWTWRMAPSYDCVSTHLLIPRDEPALTVQGKRSELKRKTWLSLAETMGLPVRLAARTLDAQAGALEAALAMTARSTLPDEQKSSHAAWLREKSSALAA